MTVSTVSGVKKRDAIAFIGLAAQRERISGQLETAIARVMAHGSFILGPEVAQLEESLAAFAGVQHCVTCANGTDALMLILMAQGIGPGDAVFVPSFTFVATAEAVRLVGATPVFCDVLTDSFNMNPQSLAAAVPHARERGLKPRAVIAVDLFGQPADYTSIAPISGELGLSVIADGAQSFGACLDGRRVGAFGAATAVSFFPAKPLGCYGDGGAILTDDPNLADLLRSLRVHGQGIDRYDNVRVGMNSRLDTIQAAILIEKLTIFDDEIQRRQVVARRYTDALGELVTVPVVKGDRISVWAQYTLCLDGRDGVADTLRCKGVPTAIYYPRPLHTQAAYREFPSSPGGLPVTEGLAKRVLSLPMHPYLDDKQIDRIVEALIGAIKR